VTPTALVTSLLISVVLGAAASVSACASGEGRPAAMIDPIAAPRDVGDGIMLVFLREFSFAAGEDDIRDEERIVSCVSEVIRKRRPARRIVPYDEFRARAFAHIDPASAPRRPEFLATLFADPEFRERVKPLRLRYVAFLGGVTEIDAEGDGGCIAGPGAVVCLGLWTWDKRSRMGAAILDLENMQMSGQTAAVAAGTAWLALVGVFPIGLPAATEQVACRDLGSGIAGFLEGAPAVPASVP